MTDFPGDIEDAADAAYAHTKFYNPRLRAAIALAIFAERERCAGICDAFSDKYRGRYAESVQAGQMLAAAIRTPQTTPKVTPQTSGGAA